MERTFWSKQQANRPLFPELEWSRPENKAHAGKLTVIGGNTHSVAAPAQAYIAATEAGVGLTRVLLPLSVKKLIGHQFEGLEFGASNPSGSFAQASLSAWLDTAQWSDATLLAGDLGRNSETSIVFEKFLRAYHGPLVITKDAVEYALSVPPILLNRPSTTVVLSMSQLQKLGTAGGSVIPFTLGMDLLRLVDALHNLSDMYSLNIITKFHTTLCVASGGKVSTTTLTNDVEIWRALTAAKAAVWWLQNPARPFEALTTAIIG